MDTDSKIQRKYERLMDKNVDQQFAVLNSHTGCWNVFYLSIGIESESFRAETDNMAARKMCVERRLNGFEYSVVSFGIRYSTLDLNDIAEVYIGVADAADYASVTDAQFDEARGFFAGTTGEAHIVEFPQE